MYEFGSRIFAISQIRFSILLDFSNCSLDIEELGDNIRILWNDINNYLGRYVTKI